MKRVLPTGRLKAKTLPGSDDQKMVQRCVSLHEIILTPARFKGRFEEPNIGPSALRQGGAEALTGDPNPRVFQNMAGYCWPTPGLRFSRLCEWGFVR
jgi:hypothetical protein